jgi:molybdenum cofactor cytidylyltransferase
MGQPKQLLDWGKKTLLGHTIETVLKIESHEVIVVLGAHFESIQTEIKNYPITILKNTNWEQGLGTSIACAAKHLLESPSNVDGLLIVLADQPFIDSNYLSNMVQSFVPQKKQIIATAYTNKKQGVPVLFDAVYLKELSKLNDDYGAKSCIQKHQLVVKTLIPPTKNLDLDTQEDYSKHHRLKFKT